MRQLTFQFHKGTIKTLKPVQNSYDTIEFQFHKGTIKTLLLLTIYLIFNNFNSIKVRLKHANVYHSFLSYYEFQFHKGTIKTAIVKRSGDCENISIP